MIIINLKHIGWELFYWPAGIVVGNLIANIIWEWPSQAIHYYRTKHQHKALHEHIDRHTDQVGDRVIDEVTGE